jgi:hypothetical protein
MTFIDADVQFAYFQVSRERRKNREMYGAFIHSAIVGCLYFDRCLDMIICHHSDIWEYGTGSLLLANKIPILPTESEKRASCWREEALDKHKYSHLFNFLLENLLNIGKEYNYSYVKLILIEKYGTYLNILTICVHKLMSLK